jgi:hypothetical protein
MCIAAACCMHLMLAAIFAEEAVPLAMIPVTEVELEPLPPPKPTEPQPEPEAEPPPTAAVAPPAKARAKRAPDRPAAARAGALLTAQETPEEKSEEPMRFVTDPNGRGYGTGIVARGGTADHGEGSAIAAPEPAPQRAKSDGITPADKLQRQPMFLGDGCRGFFPEHARPDQGQVSVIATVQSTGAIAKLEIESESPTGEGFAGAARACLAKRKFTPALDERGQPAGARTRINLRFTR